MRVLMVTPMLPYPESVSAGQLAMYDTLRVLLERHDVTLATFAGPDPAERAALDRLRADGVDVRAIWREAPAGLARWRWRSRLAVGWLRGRRPLRALEFAEPRMQRQLDQLAAAHSFDLVQVEDNAMAGYRYPSDLPRLLTEHEVRAGPPTPARSPVRRVPQVGEWLRWRRYQVVAWRGFDRVQVFTPRDAAAVLALAPEVAPRLRVNPFGVALPPAAVERSEEEDSLVFVGGFTHWPNVDAALWLGREIMPLLRARRPHARLTIVGNQPPSAVAALAGEGIVVTGRVPDVAPYLDRAAVVLAPLRSGGGMRMKVLQAMARGKAVVATPLAAEGLVVEGRAPPLMIAGRAPEFARAVADLLAAPEERRALGNAARAFVAEHHSLAAYGRRMEAIYAEIVPAAPDSRHGECLRSREVGSSA